MKPHFKIITPCWNEEKMLPKCIGSVLGQTYKNWHMAIIDDVSTDGTFSILEQYKNESKFTIVKNEEHEILRLRSLQKGISASECGGEDVLVFLDGDDMLHDENVLEYLASVYENENTWITWGSYDNVIGENTEVFGDYERVDCVYYSQPAPEDWDIRPLWGYSHLKTCKYFLWKNIKEESFISELSGDYISMFDDSFMYPMLEMAGPDHSKYIDQVLLIRTVNRDPKNFEMYNSNEQEVNMHPLHTRLVRIYARRVERVQVIKATPYLRKTKKELIENSEPRKLLEIRSREYYEDLFHDYYNVLER